MKSIYQFILDQDKAGVKLYNLSYDIEINDDKDKLHDETFLPFLYQAGIISTDIEFQFVDRNNAPIEKRTHYIVKPVATTIIFGSNKELGEIVEELLKHEELNFALQELRMNHNQIEDFVINNHFCNVDDFIKEDVAKKETQKVVDFKRYMPDLFRPKRVKVKHIAI